MSTHYFRVVCDTNNLSFLLCFYVHSCILALRQTSARTEIETTKPKQIAYDITLTAICQTAISRQRVSTTTCIEVTKPHDRWRTSHAI